MRFRAKLTLFMVMLTSIVYGTGGALLIFLTFNDSMRSAKEQAMTSYKSVLSTLLIVNSLNEQSNEQDIADVLRELNRKNSYWDAVSLHSDDKNYFTSDIGFVFDKELAESCSENICADKLIMINNAHYRQITGTFYAGDTKMYLDAAVNIENLYTVRNSQLRIYKALFAVIVLLSALISFFTAHFITRPMRTLSAVSKKIAGGDLDIRADIRSGDEMEMLSRSFNIMAEALTGKINELQEAMERQERFMGSFAHELKTPMTSMIGYADLLRSCELSQKEQRKCAEYIFHEGRRLERLSFKILDLLVLKKHDLEMKQSDPACIIDQTAEILKKKLTGKGIILTAQTEHGQCLLEEDLVRSLLINLIDNAIKSIEKDGRIKIRQKMLEDGCCISVSDNGRGIPEDELAKITEAFYRVDKSRSRKQGGAGLGLALCSEIAALHNGSISFSSTVGKGTKVTVELKGGAVSQ